ncbi:hypothetical protein ONZ45_g15634 [Pleurotus djamor]|nr:hypothetical protein ONZ45_g15634 [Pleurotus djamor]
MSTEDIFDFTYKYAWSKDSSMTLEDFLSKYRPSMVQNDGTKPWIWLHGRNEPTLADADIASATAEAGAYLKEVTERVESIKNDPAIPVRSNKKTGAKSKKEVREQVQAEAVAQLKEIAIKHKYVCGKWLIFAAMLLEYHVVCKGGGG